MPDSGASEKTEEPTSKRLQDTRSKGRVPQSQELPSVVLIGVLVAMLVLSGPNLMEWFSTQLKDGLLCETAAFSNSTAFTNFMKVKIMEVIIVLCPFFAALSVGSVLACVAVGGLNFAPGAIKLRLGALNPVSGLKQLLNAKSMVRLLTSVAKLLLVSIVAWFYLESKLDVFATLRWAWSFQILVTTAKIILGLMIRVIIALLVIAMADVIYQKRKYIKDLKMTKQEVKEERKQYEGPPESKSRIRKVQLQIAMKRMLQEVPKANVVLVNQRNEAVTVEAPCLVAKGADHLAEKIKEIARAYGVPIIRRPELARTIYSSIEPGNPIPQALYAAVAEILALIYRIRHRK